MSTYEKYTKEFEIGEYKFTLGINRAIAKDIIKESPNYTANLLEIEAYSEEHQAQDGKITNADCVFYLLKKKDIQDSACEMAQVGLSKLLAYGHDGQEKPNFFEIDYKVTALKLIDYLKDNGVWEDYNDTDNGENIQGMAIMIAQFIVEGFTKGEGQPMKKPTLAIKVK